MDVLLDALRQNPELAIFLTLRGGYLVGGIRRVPTPIGAVLGVLLVGLVVGQLGVSLAGEVKWITFSSLAVGSSSLAVAVLPHVVSLRVGRQVTKVHPRILLGISSGAWTSAPGLAALQGAARSGIPRLAHASDEAPGGILRALGESMIVLSLTRVHPSQLHSCSFLNTGHDGGDFFNCPLRCDHVD